MIGKGVFEYLSKEITETVKDLPSILTPMGVFKSDPIFILTILFKYWISLLSINSNFDCLTHLAPFHKIYFKSYSVIVNNQYLRTSSGTSARLSICPDY